MALAVSDVRAAMALQLATALPQVQIATAPDQITPPCLLIGMPSITYHGSSTRAGIDSMELPLYGILPRIHDQAAVDQADLWISGSGAQSVLTILEADQTLAGACQTLVVRSADADSWNGSTGDLPSYRWTVEVWG